MSVCLAPERSLPLGAKSVPAEMRLSDKESRGLRVPRVTHLAGMPPLAVVACTIGRQEELAS